MLTCADRLIGTPFATLGANGSSRTNHYVQAFGNTFHFATVLDNSSQNGSIFVINDHGVVIDAL